MGRPRTVDYTGNTYNMLTVLGRSEDFRNGQKWVCRCECGNITETTMQRLKSGRAKSCGCSKSKLLSSAAKKHGGFKDGKNSPEYQSFIAMTHRCLNPNRAGYENYGGKGIKICDRWLELSPQGFLNFLEDMGERPNGTSLDRIDCEGDYSPENCRWANRRTQSVNTKRKKTERNTSKYRGVSIRKVTGMFVARIGNGAGGYEWLGEFLTEEEAAIAYNRRALELHGSNAKLNEVEKFEEENKECSCIEPYLRCNAHDNKQNCC